MFNNSLYRKYVVLLFCLIYCQFISECFTQNNPSSNTQNTSDALFLTPYIRNGKLAEARQASEVTNLPVIGNAFKSYSGFFTVNSTYNSNMFFWFFPPLNGDPNCPVLLWLEGGPGLSTLIGVFVENGPMQVDPQGTPSLRNATWNREFAVLYVDNPVGTGFSFTDNDLGYATNQDEIAKNMYIFLQQFFLVYSEYRDNPFFLTGYSYGCKYIVTLGNLIHEANQSPNLSNDQRINLRGLTVGDGFCTLRNESNWANFLFQVGVIDQIMWANFTEQQNEMNRLIDSRQYEDAYNVADLLILGWTNGRTSQLLNVTGLRGMSMLRDPSAYNELRYYIPYVERPETRRAIHVGTQPLRNRTNVLNALESDIAQSVSPAIESILNRNYPTLFYNGNVDNVINTPNVENLLYQLEWKGTSKYRQATQHIYRMTNDTVAGYVRQADNLYYMVVRNAGHMVPFDQPVVALDMITRFVTAIANCTNCETNDTGLFV